MKAVQACQNLPGHQLICLLHRAPLAALTMNRPQIRLAFGCGRDLFFEAADDRHLAVCDLDQLPADGRVVELHTETLNEPAGKGEDIDRRIWFHALSPFLRGAAQMTAEQLKAAVLMTPAEIGDAVGKDAADLAPIDLLLWKVGHADAGLKKEEVEFVLIAVAAAAERNPKRWCVTFREMAAFVMNRRFPETASPQ